ncbi:MAG: hypothetical protein HOI80_02840 [Alphaproteobacteria bacterium]|jgi:methylglutaconyl-CoA hydratase|nr:hypothetical protein [Alphaproteobacteria bacterium]MBT5389258.1 hypothetical protein [Alphaproteobacteria bacterium]MBT5654419.1 hypothetical protein [Alphaproteobacteria bacterium]
MEKNLLISKKKNGLVVMTLNRPLVHNALDEDLISRLLETLLKLRENSSIRVLLIEGAGDSFCAGGDLGWMQRAIKFSLGENRLDAEKLAQLMYALDSFPAPTIAKVHGSVFGGGVGLVACCDIAFAESDAQFCFSEVRLGLTPSVISPYVLRAMGQRMASRYFLSAERFSAQKAQEMQLIHGQYPAKELGMQINKLVDSLLAGAPQAQRRAKKLIREFDQGKIGESVIEDTALEIAHQRTTDEAQEGLSAFFDKRSPKWGQD